MLERNQLSESLARARLSRRLRVTAAFAGRYQIEHQIGQGGMAIVYRARDVRNHRHVALKILKPEISAALGPDRFLNEIRLTANLQHPHILPLFDSGEVGGLLFYAMPLVTGKSLRDRLDRNTLLPVDEAVRIARKVATALDFAHREGVVHRDIKPENILLSDEIPLIADFGVAVALNTTNTGRITLPGLALGTPDYMSPEQALGEPGIDGRTDIYALACVLYEMLTGEPPYSASTLAAVVVQRIAAPVPSVRRLRKEVPRRIEAVIARSLSCARDERFPSAAEFAAALSNGTSPMTARGRAIA